MPESLHLREPSCQNAAMIDDPRQFLCTLFDKAVETAGAERCLKNHLPTPPRGRTVIVGAGKAAAAMASAVEARWSGELTGVVVTPYGHGAPTRYIEVVEASHPVPDDAGTRGARQVLEAVQGLSEDDLVLCLISGGGSALLAYPADGIALDDKRTITKALLRSGASIHEINCVRKHLSAIKGGRLATLAAPTTVLTLAISDVPGDDISVIASGPTVADPSTRDEAVALLKQYRIEAPTAVWSWLERPESETPKPGDPALGRSGAAIIATPQDSLNAAADYARSKGVTPIVLGDTIEGEARDVALVHAAIAREVVTNGRLAAPPAVIISGGETTVTLRGEGGSGGRNQEFLLALAGALNGMRGVHALACDTDGIDGFSKAAGAVIDPTTPERAAALNISLTAMLERQDSFGFFDALGDSVVTGPTRTNVNDFRAILILT